MLKIRRIRIDTYRENVAVLSRSCDEYRPEEYQALKKIEIGHNGGQLLATLIIADDRSIVGDDEIGLSEQAFQRLGLPEATQVTIAPAPPPQSLDAVRAKIHGHTLNAKQIESIIPDIAAHRYSDMEITAFLISSASFLTTEEMLAVPTKNQIRM